MAGRRLNSVYMLAGQVVGKAGLFASLMIYSRILTDDPFGELLLSVSIGLIILFFSDMGATMILTRKLSTGAETDEELGKAILLRTGLSVISLALIFSAVTLAGYSQRQIILVLLVSTGFVFDGFSETIYAVFRALERMKYEGAARILHGILCTSFAVYAWQTGRGVMFAGLTYVFRALPVLLFALAVLAVRMKHHPRLDSSAFRGVFPLFRVALPLGLAGILIAGGQRLDGVFIKEFMGDAAIAAYQQCLKIFEALVLVITPTLLPGALFPGLCRAVKNGWAEARAQISWMTELFLVIAFALIIPMWTLSTGVLGLLWGEAFQRGLPLDALRTTFRLVLLTLPPAYIFNLFMPVTIATGRQKRVVPAVLTFLIVEAGLFIVLIPNIGIQGAALAYMIFLAGSACWMAMDLHRAFGSTGFIRGASRPVLAFVPGLFFLLSGPFNDTMNGLAAGGLFILLWLVFGGWKIFPGLRRN